jgi:hypothetical protein
MYLGKNACKNVTTEAFPILYRYLQTKNTNIGKNSSKHATTETFTILQRYLQTRKTMYTCKVPIPFIIKNVMPKRKT